MMAADTHYNCTFVTLDENKVRLFLNLRTADESINQILKRISENTDNCN